MSESAKLLLPKGPLTDNVLYYGDNLDVLRRHGRDESVDLVYDPGIDPGDEPG